METLTFEFESEKELRDIVKKLWDNSGVTGELTIRPLGDGRWRMQLTPERELRSSTLERLAPYRVDTGD